MSPEPILAVRFDTKILWMQCYLFFFGTTKAVYPELTGAPYNPKCSRLSVDAENENGPKAKEKLHTGRFAQFPW